MFFRTASFLYLWQHISRFQEYIYLTRGLPRRYEPIKLEVKKIAFEGHLWSPPTREQIYEAIGQGLYYQGQHRSNINALAQDIAYTLTSFEGLSEDWGDNDSDVPEWYDSVEIRDGINETSFSFY